MPKKIYFILIMIITLFMSLLLPNFITKVNAEENNNIISYATHVQTYGWQNYVKNGQMSGTQGEAKRLEGIKIKLENSSYSGGVQYRTHVQSYGWQDFVSDNQMSGTSGEAKRLEAIEIKLTGEMANHYDIYYRVHAQTYGWLDWAKNGESAGTAALAKRLEGIEIVLVEKGEPAPGSTNRPFVQPLINYQTHVQSYGWQNYVKDGEMSGTQGKAKRLEGVKIKLVNQKYDGDIEYRTHIQKLGWEEKYKKNDEMSGTSGKALRLEAIQIRLTGEIAEHYDVYYRVHAQKYGWLGWAKNDEMAGTAGFAYRLEGIEIKLIDKNESFNEKTNNHFIENKDGYYIIDNNDVQIVDNKYIINKERKLINQIKGYYWYLDGYDAYITVNEIEWYDHHVLDVWPYYMEYYKGKIVAEGDEDYLTYLYDTNPKTENLRNLLLENPSETGTKLITNYDMQVKNDKLYIKINNNTYTFTKSSTQKPVLLSLDTDNLTINRGETINLNLGVDYYHTKHKISYTSSNPEIATCFGTEMTYDGHINIRCSGKKAGNTKIRIRDLEGGNFVEFNVKVNYAVIHPTEIKLYDDKLNTITSLDLVKDDLMQLKAFVIPSDSDNTRVKWSSNNTAVASVTDSGKIKAKSKGTAIITVTSDDDSSVKATCIVNVSNLPLKTISSFNEHSQIISGSKVSEVYISIDISGGTERYSCDYVRIYKDGVIIKEGDCEKFQNTINNSFSLWVYPAESGDYHADYQFRDSDGEISSGVTETITISDD